MPMKIKLVIKPRTPEKIANYISFLINHHGYGYFDLRKAGYAEYLKIV